MGVLDLRPGAVTAWPRFDHVPEIRSLHLVDPVFGPIVFVGVLVGPMSVEIAAFRYDPDYWDLIEDDPKG